LRFHTTQPRPRFLTASNIFSQFIQGIWGLSQDTDRKLFAGSVATLPMLAVLLSLRSQGLSDGMSI